MNLINFVGESRAQDFKLQSGLAPASSSRIRSIAADLLKESGITHVLWGTTGHICNVYTS